MKDVDGSWYDLVLEMSSADDGVSICPQNIGVNEKPEIVTYPGRF